jgi:hypothetical protein
MEKHNFLYGQVCFPRMVKPIEEAPIFLSLEKVTVRAGPKVLIVVDI